MTITVLPRERIAHEWRWLSPLVSMAIEYLQIDVPHDAILNETFERLKSGQYEVAKITVPGEAAGIVISEICEIGGVKVCWLPFIAGQTKYGPRAFVKFMRGMMAVYEELARSRGCEEMRIGGRDWSRVLPGYERFDDVPNRLRKKLL